MTDTVIECAGEQLLLHPDRAVVWPAMRTAFIADLHLGKSEIFRRSGIPIPEGNTRADLERLGRIIQAHHVERVVLLGDFLHGASPGISTHGAIFLEWRERHPRLQFIVVAGNHDRRAAGTELVSAVEWQTRELRIGPFVCRHDPGESPDGYVLAGHLHPVVCLFGSHRERARLPVYWMRRGYAVLPSFGSFTGGYEIEPVRSDRVFGFAAERVWQLPASGQ